MVSESIEQLQAETAAGNPPLTEEEFRREQSRVARLLRDLVVPALALFTGLLVGALIIAVSAPDFWDHLRHGQVLQAIGTGAGLAGNAYYWLLKSAFGSRQAWSETGVQTVPLLFVGLSAAFSFRGGFFNIGAQGQFLFGAMASVLVANHFAGMPGIIHIPIVLILGFLGGAAWGSIAGILKARTGANEVITTLMLNYVAVYLVNWLLITPVFQRPGFPNPVTSEVVPSALLPALPGYRIHLGLIIVLICAGVIWWLLFRTTFGFQLQTVGANAAAATYAGMSVAWTYVMIMVIAGGLAGMAGTTQLLTTQTSVIPDFAGSYGFDAITVAILGRLHPIGVIFAAFLLGSLRAGAIGMQSATSLPYYIIIVIQAVIIAFMTSPQLIRQIFRVRQAAATGSESFSKGWAA
jgi:simple sugar transport system permease protein